MPHRPSLSVVLLNYNHGHFITEALTALAEGLSPDDEFIVIDDASRDDSVAILEWLRPRFPAMRLVVHAQNQGVVAGMNEGLRLASRDYIYFAAADDRIMPRLFDASLSLLAVHPTAAICTARTQIMDKSGRDLGLLKTPVVSTSPRYLSPEDVALASYRDDNWLVGCSTIYRRDLISATGGFRPELGSFCDGFASRLLAFQHGACFIPDVLSCWRRMSEGYSQSETADLARVERCADTTLSLLRGPYAHIFPPAYADRWRRRWVFGARAHALYGWRMRRAKDLKSTLTRGLSWLAPIVDGLVAGAWTARLIFLFLRMRPFDVWPALQRRLGYLREIRPGR